MPTRLVGAIQLVPAAEGDPTPVFLATWFSCAGVEQPRLVLQSADRPPDERAKSLQATDPRAAAAVWAKIDRELVDRGAWVPLFNERAVDFVSARVHNYEFHPVGGFMADQAWLS